MPTAIIDPKTTAIDPEPENEEDAFRELRPPTTINGRKNSKPQERDILATLPDLDSAAREELRDQRADLQARIEKLLADESARDETIAEIRARAIDKPPSWKEREALEKRKIELLQRRAEICAALAIHAIDCFSEIYMIREGLAPEIEIQDAVAEKMREAGFLVERRGGGGPFQDTRGIGSHINGVILGHPEVMAHRARRHSLANTEARWNNLEQAARSAKAAADAAVEAERRRIMEVA